MHYYIVMQIKGDEPYIIGDITDPRHVEDAFKVEHLFTEDEMAGRADLQKALEDWRTGNDRVRARSNAAWFLKELEEIPNRAPDQFDKDRIEEARRYPDEPACRVALEAFELNQKMVEVMAGAPFADWPTEGPFAEKYELNAVPEAS